MRRLLASTGIVLLAVTALAGCNNSTSGAAASPREDTGHTPTNSTKVNWFIDKDRKPVAQDYVNWEAEKQQKKIPTDLIIIHHTAGTGGMTWKKLSDLQYQKLYIGRYKIDDPDPLVKGWIPHSGHYRMVNGKKVEVFYAYHWLVRADGSAERLLNDDEVGWNSGDWDKNMRSIAICFDGDFTESKPSPAALNAAAKLIAGYKKKFKISDVIGHKDIHSTRSPGSWWPVGKSELSKLKGE